ncbi:MAG: 4Fe-4S dicluster domain-containing protein [Tissierellia bacterium]|nr:4Fe-4S dicluster domain-containing protein [Tissierellia bacterium]
MKKLGFGLMRLPLIDPEDSKTIDLKRFEAMVDLFMAKGFTHFDTAYVYHGEQSERIFKECVVDRYPRESFTVTDKMPIYMVEKKEDLEEFFNRQLERCGVEYFDYYWMHALNASRYETCNEIDAFGFFQEKQKEGKIRHIGFSFHDSAEVLDNILSKEPCIEFVQLQINYLDWEDGNIQSRLCYEVARKHNKKIFIMEPVKGGTLAKLPEEAEAMLKSKNPQASIASWALRYAASLEDVVMVLSGMTEEWHLEDNIEIFENLQPLEEEDLTLLDQVVEIIKKDMKIACTACRYCVDGCPVSIAIPEYFAIYNRCIDLSNPDDPALREDFLNLTSKHGKPWECIECGQCEEQCPQFLPIIEDLKKISAIFKEESA